MKKISYTILSAAAFSLLPSFLGAAVWESSGWALTANADAFAGYDSNLTLSQNGQGTGFTGVKPTLVLVRRNAGARIDGTLQLQETVYSERSYSSQTDYLAALNFAYPYADDRLPRTTASIDWSRATIADPWAAARVKVESINARAAARLFYSGKLGVNTEVFAFQSKYLSLNNNENKSFEGAVGVGYEKTPLSIYSLNVAYGYSESADGLGLRGKSKSIAATVFLKAEGELLPKLKGSVRAGVTRADYSGEIDGSLYLPTAGVRLAWALTSRGTLAIDGAAVSGFSAEGQRAERRTVSLRYEQVVFEEWSGFAGTRLYDNKFSRNSFDRSDKGWVGETGLSYDPSRRFRAQLALEQTHQNSDEVRFDYTRTLVRVSGNFRF